MKNPGYFTHGCISSEDCQILQIENSATTNKHMGGRSEQVETMTQYRPSSITSVKQGYLHIKRERSSSPVTARVLFKSWQQAYFILKRDPLIMEEYKDASLKTQKQLHFIGTIKHVGIIRTSKSQQFAFEVVMKEKTPLLLACENQMLMEEWISAFSEIMRAVGELQCPSKTTAMKQLHSALERKSSMHDAHRVVICESLLSRANDLFGEYYLILSPTRMSLLGLVDLNEVLSWPMSHVTYYTNQQHTSQVFLIMGRACHFGTGKLIFETKQNEQIVRYIEMHHTKCKSDSPKPKLSSRSFNSRSSAGSHTPSVNGSHSSNGSISMSEKSIFRMSYDEDCLEKPVFDSPRQDPKLQFHSKHLELEKTLSYSIPDVSDDNKMENNHKALRRTGEFHTYKFNKSAVSPVSDALLGVIVGNDTKIRKDNEVEFAEITTEEGYVLPNEPEQLSSILLSHSQQMRDSLQSSNSSDGETEPSSYLQIIDNEEPNDPLAKRILDDITDTLTDPVNKPSFLAAMALNVSNKKCKSGSFVENGSPKMKLESRRSSEPAKKTICSKSFDKDQNKKLPKKGNSIDSPDRSHSPVDVSGLSSKNSPQVSPKHPHSPSMSRSYNQKAFPKQYSISQGSHTGFINTERQNPLSNPFHNAESFLTRPIPLSQSFNGLQHQRKLPFGIRRNHTDSVLSATFKSPELDRNMKPKQMSNSVKALDIPVVSTTASQTTEDDSPPPVPERLSPQLLKSHTRHKLQRKAEIIEEDEDLSSSSEKLNRKSSTESSVSSLEQCSEKESIADSLLMPPPLPPKSKLLSCTKSAPIPSREENNEDKEALTRRSSFTTCSLKEDQLSDISCNGPIIVTSMIKTTSVEQKLEANDSPPAVPKRLPVHPLSKGKHLSTSEGNLLKSSISDLKPLRKTSECSGNLSKSELQFASILMPNNSETDTKIDWLKRLKSSTARRSTVHEYSLQASITDNERKFSAPVIPKILTSSLPANGFPRAPKKFF